MQVLLQYRLIVILKCRLNACAILMKLMQKHARKLADLVYIYVAKRIRFWRSCCLGTVSVPSSKTHQQPTSEDYDVRSNTPPSFPLVTQSTSFSPWATYWSIPPLVDPLLFANLAWRTLSWCRRTSVRPPDDTEKSVAHRLHYAMPVSGNFAIQA